jgi:hypothetical protein
MYGGLAAEVQLPKNGTALDLYDAMNSYRSLETAELTTGSISNVTDSTFLRLDLVRSIYRALSYAERGDETVALGRIAEAAFKNLLVPEQAELANGQRPLTADAMALANFLRELATRPSEFGFVLHAIIAAGPDIERRWMPLSQADLTPLRQLLARARPGAAHVDRLVTTVLQMNEFVRRWHVSDQSGAPNFFRGMPHQSA